MREFFETKIQYFDKDTNKTKKPIFFVQALSFTEAEANITQYLEDEEIESFQVLAMKRNRYEALVYPLQVLEDLPFFELKAKIGGEGAKDFVNCKFLVSAENVEHATQQVLELAEDSGEDAKVYYVKHKELSDLVLKKECEKGGVIVIGFDEQKKIELKILEAERAKMTLEEMQGRGEIKIELKTN